MESKVVLDGRIRVFEDGTVKRILNGIESDATIHYAGTKNRIYGAVSAGGKLHYVHRLVASHFVPPYTGECVNHKDGNKMNNEASNLEWCTSQENTQHAYRTGLINHYRNGNACSVCGKPVTDRRGKDHEMCGVCERLVASKAFQIVKEMRLADLAHEIETVKKGERKELFQELHLLGFTMREIGGMCGISRERVHQIMEAGK